MLVATKRYGVEIEEFEVSAGDIFELYPGLPSFEDHHRYALLSEADSPVEWLQSLDDPTVAFAVLDPFLFCADYAFELSDADAAALGLVHAGDAKVRALLTLATEASDITANLFAPVILNAAMGLGRQVLLQDSGWSLRFQVFSGLQVADDDRDGRTIAPESDGAFDRPDAPPAAPEGPVGSTAREIDAA